MTQKTEIPIGILNGGKNPADGEHIKAVCTRCEKEFISPVIHLKKPGLPPKTFKRCPHCREMQRRRSKRWQTKTKDKGGVCRRCGDDLIEGETFVLCSKCRTGLRSSKTKAKVEGPKAEEDAL